MAQHAAGAALQPSRLSSSQLAPAFHTNKVNLATCAPQAQRELRARALEVRVAAEEAARVEVSREPQSPNFPWGSAACACAVRQADKAEAALRADEHRRQLAAAAASLWQQSDRVKALAGAALLGEVLAERQLQIAGAVQAVEAARRVDAAFLVAQRQRIEVRLCLRRLSVRPRDTACWATFGACMSRACSKAAPGGAHVDEASHCTAQQALGTRLHAVHACLSQVCL